MFLVNSRFSLVSAAGPRCRRRTPSRAPAPLLPKLRGHFAEFLNHSSLERLGILYLTTCVGLGYGPRSHSLEAFLGSRGSSTSPGTARHRLSESRLPGFTWETLLPPYPGTTIARAGLPSCVPPSLTYPRLGPRPAVPPPRKGTALLPAQHHRDRHGRDSTGTGISTRCPSTTPVGLALGPDSPWAD